MCCLMENNLKHIFQNQARMEDFQMGHIIQVDIGIVMMEKTVSLDHDIVLVKFYQIDEPSMKFGEV